MGAKRFFGLWGISVVVAWFGHEAKTEAKRSGASVETKMLLLQIRYESIAAPSTLHTWYMTY